MNNSLPLSVVICTYNRAELLKMTLESIEKQTLDKADYEVIIIDDGSSDSTKEIADSFSKRLPLKYFFQRNAGLASAKNHGVYASQGEILLFFDDDDIATSTLLEEHLKTHRQYPDKNYAVLHYTRWSPDLFITPLMHYVTEVGGVLFSYPDIKNGDILDFTYFWGGRSSCKRSFLIEHGVFNPLFRYYEDIELAYRLSFHGLQVVYNARAVAEMVRPVTFDDFCHRILQQGRLQFFFSQLHNDPAVNLQIEVSGADEKWDRIKTIYDEKLRSARELDRIANSKLKYNLGLDDQTRSLLYKAYWWAFKACKIKGIADAKRDLARQS